MPMWAIIATVAFSGILMIVSVASFLRSFQFATKEDIKNLEERLEKDIGELRDDIKNVHQRIDRHLEGHA